MVGDCYIQYKKLKQKFWFYGKKCNSSPETIFFKSVKILNAWQARIVSKPCFTEDSFFILPCYMYLFLYGMVLSFWTIRHASLPTTGVLKVSLFNSISCKTDEISFIKWDPALAAKLQKEAARKLLGPQNGPWLSSSLLLLLNQGCTYIFGDIFYQCMLWCGSHNILVDKLRIFMIFNSKLSVLNFGIR